MATSKPGSPPAPDRAAVNRALVRLITKAAIGLGVFLSGFVINEPAPYELYMAGLIAIWALFGLRISRTAAVLLALLVLFNFGGVISATQMPDLKSAPLYIAVSLFLAFTAVFFAAIIEADYRRLQVIFRAYYLAALITSVCGILGYFDAFPGADMFTLYGRAKGAFQDPNVFGPFLILPMIWSIHQILTGRLRALPLHLLPLLIIVFGLFLSFSRAAWGMLAVAMILLPLILAIRNRSNKFRLKLIILAILALLIIGLALAASLQIPRVAELFFERAQLVQSYDSDRIGRFARHWYGLVMAVQHPLGIGPLEFGPIYGEDTHNIWLKAALDYGWLGFIAFLTMTMLTIGMGLRILLRDRPWQPFLLCAYLTYLTHVMVGNVIDTDHWRHFYLLIGIIWGCVALENRYQENERRMGKIIESRSNGRQ
ncbi:O-antigen ligase domain-containing protein [Phyllobacterium salinisoli]|uniref:O-antigen ligase domain-containing protein n=1 Tax=Phyllobacterium salinisoli TaxID=1899321 RepID=A0A368K125_9HYPH|nr:O-antigen ligase family protein [Phyllobacterium salinisoli]RCS23096.1 O-antigen ligase domain-containing protein [Phyllobacterium salinisoli]